MKLNNWNFLKDGGTFEKSLLWEYGYFMELNINL